ncbi:MAG: hypothetical protein K6C98_02555 [Treponema sp.]|nr:hypothetical protein [Treponema sp.]
MTLEEITEIKELIKSNELYQKSTSPYKEFQFEQFSSNGEILEGQHSRTEIINGKEVIVIFNFKNGLIHSENNLPAVEYPMHWEYWNNGLITKVVDDGGNTNEFWENGFPVRIENNLSDENN